jgi:hypothetical protein
MQDVKTEFGRLVQAAVVNRSFRASLLNDPLGTIQSGYCGEDFFFPQDFLAGILSIKAKSLEEFAAQFLQGLTKQGKPEMAVVQYCGG